MKSDVILVTAESHPALFKAFELISHDSGNQADHTNYAVPIVWAEDLEFVDRVLGLLSPEELETLAIGEDEENKVLVKKFNLQKVDKLLQEFFEDI